jgi:hypothetical protein
LARPPIDPAHDALHAIERRAVQRLLELKREGLEKLGLKRNRLTPSPNDAPKLKGGGLTASSPVSEKTGLSCAQEIFASSEVPWHFLPRLG